MSALRTLRQRCATAVQRVQHQYAGDERRPLVPYARVMAVYVGAVGAVAASAGLTGRTPPARVEPYDLVTIGLATHKLSRILAKDPVTSPLRAPFTEYAGVSGPAELNEQARSDEPARHAVGEMLTCPFCLDMWVASAFTSGLVFTPRLTRLAAATFSALATADYLQLLYARAERAAS